VSTGDSIRLDNPLLVRWEYASEERLATRNKLQQELIEGVNPDDVIVAAAREAEPGRLLDVGSGTGDLGARLVRELGSELELVCVDLSERMVRLCRERGLDARVADVQELPFDEGEFDCAVAAWVLYHVADRHRALAELARVLRPGGRLIAATMDHDYLRELWELLGVDSDIGVGFSGETGEEQLRPHFDVVERREANGALVFPTPESMRSYVAATMTRAHLAPDVPSFEGPFRATAHHTIFIAEKSR